MQISEHFTYEEMQCPHCGQMKMNPVTMERLERLRRKWGKPMHISSAYRCPVHNEKVSKTGKNGPHTTGQAVDVLLLGGDVVDFTLMAKSEGFTGFGWSQKGEHLSRFVHIDDLPDAPAHPRPWTWTY